MLRGGCGSVVHIEWHAMSRTAEEKMSQLVSPVLVALLWGVTTPFLRQGSRGIRAVGCEGQSWWRKHLQEIRFLLRWQVQIHYLSPFLNASNCLLPYAVPGPLPTESGGFRPLHQGPRLASAVHCCASRQLAHVRLCFPGRSCDQ